MIIGVRGIQRTGKDAICIKIIKQLHAKKMFDFCFANATVKIPKLKYEKLATSVEMLDKMTQQINIGKTRMLYYISEAHRVLNPLLFSKRKAQETFDIAGIFQDDKLESYIIYNCHNGNTEETLLGVDKMLRGGTNLYIDILSTKEFVRATKWVIVRYTWTDEHLVYEDSIYVGDVFDNFISKEVIK